MWNESNDMTLVHSVRSHLSQQCFGSHIRKGRCSLSLSSAPTDRLIVDLDRPGAPIGKDEQRCDYLFFANIDDGADWVVPIELKGGPIKTSKVVGQLQSGADAVAKLIPGTAIVRVVPVAATRGIHREERRRLSLRKVTFRGVRRRIRLLPCGSRLAVAFGK